MLRGEKLPKGEPKSLSPEKKSAIGDAGFDAMDQFLASKLPVRLSSKDMAPVALSDVVGAPAPDATQATQSIDNQTPLKTRRGSARKIKTGKAIIPPAVPVALTPAPVVVPSVVMSLPDKPADAPVVLPTTPDVPKAPEVTPKPADVPVSTVDIDRLGVPEDHFDRGYDELFEGDVWVLLQADGTERRITVNVLMEYAGKKSANITRSGGTDIDKTITLDDQIVDIGDSNDIDLETLRQVLRENKYTREKHGTTSERFSPLERVKTQEEKESEKSALINQELLDKIAGLETLVKEERFKYAEADYKKKSVLGRLSAFFRKPLEGPPDPDSEFWRVRYTNALTALQNAQLEKIKLSGVSGDALKQEMAGLLQYYKVNEVVELYQARTQVRLETKKEGKSFGERTIDSIDNFGRAYNKLGWKKKLLIAGAVLGSATILGATGGVAGVAIGSTLIFARKVVTSIGSGIALDTVFEQAGKYLGDKFDQKEIAEQMGALDTHLDSGSTIGTEDYVKNMEALLSGELQSIDAKFQKKKWQGKARKLSAFTLSTGLSFVSYALHGASGSGVAEHGETRAVTGFNQAARSALSPASATEMTSPSLVLGSSSVLTGPSLESLSEGPLAPPVSATTEIPINMSEGTIVDFAQETPADVTAETTATGAVNAIRETYTVSAIDGKKGLWGIIERRLPADMFKGDHHRVIQSLENAMRAKLDAMSPAERASVGFSKSLENGKVNLDFIKINDTIDFGKLLNAQEIQDVIDGKSIASPNVARMAETVSGTHTSVAGISDMVTGLQDTASRIPDVVTPTEKLEIIGGFEGAHQVAENSALSDAQSYLSVHPEQVPVFNSTLGKLQTGIFALNPGEGGVPFEYDYAVNGEKLGATKIVNVLKNLKGFEDGRLGYNRDLNPLHYDQMKALQKFIAVAEKTFGPEVAQVEAGESISHYTERMATASLQTGRNITDFWKSSLGSVTSFDQVIDQPNPAVATSEVGVPRMPVVEHAVVHPGSVIAANETSVENAREVALFRQACAQNVGALRHDILLTPPAGMTSMVENFHMAKYDYAINPSLGRINVARVLEAAWELHHGPMRLDRPLDWARYPLHPTQVESVARAVSVAQDPRVLGVWGAPLSGETIDKYTARIGVALTKANKAQMFSALLHGRDIRFAA